MMGTTKLSTIRAEVRKAFRMSDEELLAWFDERLQASGEKRKADQTAIETLVLLRDALLKETKRPRARRKSPRKAGPARR